MVSEPLNLLLMEWVRGNGKLTFKSAVNGVG